MELKYINPSLWLLNCLSSNRTFMELKLVEIRAGNDEACLVLIVPLWN